MAYTTKTEVENYLQAGISSDLDTQVTAWIESVKAWIDRYTDRVFEAGISSVKKYDGMERDFIVIDDILSLEKVWFVSNDSTADGGTRELTTSDIYLYQDDNPNKTPYNKLEINPNSAYGRFPFGKQNIWVKGVFGYSETVPADIRMVATKLVASIIQAGKNDGAQQYSEGDLSVIHVSYDKIINQDLGVKQILDFYKKKSRITGFSTIRI